MCPASLFAIRHVASRRVADNWPNATASPAPCNSAPRGSAPAADALLQPPRALSLSPQPSSSVRAVRSHRRRFFIEFEAHRRFVVVVVTAAAAAAAAAAAERSRLPGVTASLRLSVRLYAAQWRIQHLSVLVAMMTLAIFLTREYFVNIHIYAL